MLLLGMDICETKFNYVINQTCIRDDYLQDVEPYWLTINSDCSIQGKPRE